MLDQAVTQAAQRDAAASAPSSAAGMSSVAAMAHLTLAMKELAQAPSTTARQCHWDAEDESIAQRVWAHLPTLPLSSPLQTSTILPAAIRNTATKSTFTRSRSQHGRV